MFKIPKSLILLALIVFGCGRSWALRPWVHCDSKSVAQKELTLLIVNGDLKQIRPGVLGQRTLALIPQLISGLQLPDQNVYSIIGSSELFYLSKSALAGKGGFAELGSEYYTCEAD